MSALKEIGPRLLQAVQLRDTGGHAYPPKVGVFLMQKDEVHLFPQFVHYYGTLFGHENIHVFDNGSSPDLDAGLADAEALGVRIDPSFASAEDFERKGEILSRAMNEKRGEYDILLPLDCDEFIGLRTADGGYSCRRDDLLDFFASLPSGAYHTGERLRNDPADIGRYFVWGGLRKLFFVRCKSTTLDVGFHNCRYPIRKTATALCHFEFHHKPFEILQRHARNKLRLRVDVTDPDAVAQYVGPGMHLVPILTMRSEVEYQAYLARQDWFRTDALRIAFDEMGLGNPFG